MQVTTHQDLADPSLIDAWQRVLAATPDGSAFQGPVWLEAWARLRGTGTTIVRSFAASPGDDPIGIVAEVDHGNGRRSIAGGRDVT
ncbi:MAG: CelD/BcsL family acetyltransferase involved in cellulose biosynthesis, partial [Glaciecola sp.]